MADWKVVAAQIKAFDDRREVLKAMRKGIRQPVPEIRKSIRQRALATLPHRGGLNRWVAAVRVNAAIKLGSRRVSMKLKGGRNSAGARSDISSIDRGRVRALTWGHRPWHSQTVPSGFFTKPAQDGGDRVRKAIDDAVDVALDTIRNG